MQTRLGIGTGIAGFFLDVLDDNVDVSLNTNTAEVDT
jgi:hypothetical protein